MASHELQGFRSVEDTGRCRGAAHAAGSHRTAPAQTAPEILAVEMAGDESRIKGIAGTCPPLKVVG